MKKNLVLISVIMMVFIIPISSCKKDNTVPVEKKKYAWVVGEQDSTGYGMILFTPDAGETWERQGEGSAALQDVFVSDIWAIDEDNVWACGSNNTILKTTNGGKSWTSIQVPSSLSDAQLSSISVVNKTNIWVCGSYGTANNGIIYKSTDSGNTWIMLDTTFFNKNALQGIGAINTEKVYVTGSNRTQFHERGFIGYTLDGGITWDSITPENDFNKWIWIGVAFSGNTIVINGSKAHYLVSIDAGNTWKNDSVPHTGGEDGADFNDLIMLNSQTWWGAFDMGEIYITTDGGTTWNEQQTPGLGGNFMVGIDSWNNQLALSVPLSNVYPARCPIIKTENGGLLWNKKYTCNSNLLKVSFIKD